MVTRTIRLSDGTILRVAAVVEAGVVRIALDDGGVVEAFEASRADPVAAPEPEAEVAPGPALPASPAAPLLERMIRAAPEVRPEARALRLRPQPAVTPDAMNAMFALLGSGNREGEQPSPPHLSESVSIEIPSAPPAILPSDVVAEPLAAVAQPLVPTAGAAVTEPDFTVAAEVEEISLDDPSVNRVMEDAGTVLVKEPERRRAVETYYEDSYDTPFLLGPIRAAS